MYQYSQSPSPPDMAAMQPAGPPGWAPFQQYWVRQAVYYGGTYWRCEVPHSSGPEHISAPSRKLHIWTPLSSVGPPNQAYYGGQQGFTTQPEHHDPAAAAGPSAPPSYAAGPGIYAPMPVAMPSKPPLVPNERDDSPSSQASDETVKNQDRAMGETGGFLASNSMFQNRFSHAINKAGDSLRYLTLQEESRKARDKDELKDEARGKRIWRVGGIGNWSYSLDEREETLKREVWSKWAREHNRDDWLKVSRQRTEFYAKESKGVKPLYTWKLVEGAGGGRQTFPHDALPIGREEDGQVLYAARTWHEGGLHPGKAAPHLPNGVSIPYGGAELTCDAYEILCGPGDPELLKWMTFRHGESARVEGWQPVEGGREADGTALLLAKGLWENGEHPGKCLINDDHACVGWGGGEVWVRPYQILAYSTAHRR